ncbi:MAG: hypothetical protein BWY44_00159 [Candidatus Omnitrophica bacterium ADurb.Bin292]|nr:MAG: hypothetical protein BWY44_00159 [Candidatus Omnitrophica bacterium ADurb.Bin292]
MGVTLDGVWAVKLLEISFRTPRASRHYIGYEIHGK